MGTIKDLVDLTTQLANTVEDQKVAVELTSIQSLILELQSEQTHLHDANNELKEERLSHVKRIHELVTKIQELTSSSTSMLNDILTCPNCSTRSKSFFMRHVAKDFVEILNATY